MLCIAKRTGRWPRISPCTRRLERVGRLAVSSRPPPLSFAQVEHLGLPRQRPAGRGTFEEPCSEFTSSPGRTVGGVVCRRTRLRRPHVLCHM